MKRLLGYKKGMTSIYNGDKVVPVTIVTIPVNTVYSAKKRDRMLEITIGIGSKKNPNKAELGKYGEVKNVPVRTLTYGIAEDQAAEKVGTEYSVKDLNGGDFVSVVGVTKSKGFAGVMKRWGFKGGPRTHGQSDRQRAPGSIGAGTDPGRVLKGQKMPGRMGGVRRTFKDREIMDVGEDYVLIKGSLPGSVGGLLQIELTSKNES